MSRIGPVRVPPLKNGDVIYEATWADEGMVVAKDEKTGKELWSLKVYDYYVEPNLERDVQHVYITNLEMTNGGEDLLVVDERKRRHVVNLKTHEVSTIDWYAKVRIVESKPSEDGWQYWVELKIENVFKRPIELDKASIGFDNSITNNLFHVTFDGQPVRYNGMMKKRAPPGPDGFVKVEPGKAYVGLIELTKEYPIPPGNRKVTVQFEHRNHFSKDHFFMKSAVESREFEGEGFKLTPRPEFK